MQINLRNAYRLLVKLIENLILKIHILKTWIFEWIVIFKKRKYYKNICWTKTEKKKFDDFWKNAYGKKISSRWHKFYQSCNGVFDVSYFPEILFTTKLEPKLNPFHFCKTLSNKSLTELLYGCMDSINFPKTILLNCDDFYYDCNRNILNPKKAKEIVWNAGKVVIKPIIGGSSGEGVIILNIKNGIDTLSSETVESLILNYKGNFIIQNYLKQHKAYSAIYGLSINTIRVTTYITNNMIFHVPLCLRVGTNGEKVDNIHAGGIGIGVSDEGVLKKVGYNYKNERFFRHPDTGFLFEGHKLPFTKQIIEHAYKSHGRTPYVGIVSWDFMVDEQEHIILIEANYIAQGIWFPQIVNSCSPFGTNSEMMIKLISNKRDM